MLCITVALGALLAGALAAAFLLWRFSKSGASLRWEGEVRVLTGPALGAGDHPQPSRSFSCKMIIFSFLAFVVGDAWLDVLGAATPLPGG